jgi:hypothetical protein
MRYRKGPGLEWGNDRLQAGNTLHTLPITPRNVIVQPGGSILAMPPLGQVAKSQIFIYGAWNPSGVYGPAIGRTGYYSRAPILINGKWRGIQEYAPQVSELWTNSSVNLLDTTPGGWVLVQEGVWPLLGISFPKYAVLLPIRAAGVDPALSIPPLVPPANPPEYFFGGVDHTSMTAYGGNAKVPEIWIMAPNGGASNSVRFQSPLNPTCKLTLVSDDDVEFSPGELNKEVVVVQVSDKKTDTAAFPAKLKLGGTVESLSVPLQIKAMKKRTVTVAVHKVFGIDGSGNQTVPTHFPAMSDLENYLNEVFGRQSNTFFQCLPPIDEKGTQGAGIDFDFANGQSDQWIGYGITDPEVQALTVNPKSVGNSATANIDIWVFGGGVRIADANHSYVGYQIGAEFEGKIIIDGDLSGLQGTPSELSAQLLDTFAHEIGHVMVGLGHPDAGN